MAGKRKLNKRQRDWLQRHWLNGDAVKHMADALHCSTTCIKGTAERMGLGPHPKYQSRRPKRPTRYRCQVHPYRIYEGRPCPCCGAHEEEAA